MDLLNYVKIVNKVFACRIFSIVEIIKTFQHAY